MQDDKADNRPATKADKTLRQRAAQLVQMSAVDLDSMSNEDIQRLFFELQIHQVELTLQNEELREAQVKLASSRDRYAQLYNFAPVGYVSLDNAGFIVEANLAIADFLGVNREHLLQSRFSNFIAPQSQDTAHLYWQQVHDSEQRQVCEMEMHRSDETPLFVRLESIRFNAAHALEPQYRVAVIDIADTRQAQQALQSLNDTLEQRVSKQVGEIELMASAISNLSEGVLIANNHREWWSSQIVFANEALCQMLGYSVDEMLQMSPAMLVEDGFVADNTEQLQAQINSNHIFAGEIKYRCKDGSLRDVDISISPILDATNKRTNYVAVTRDTTERNLEAELLRENRERLQAILDTTPDSAIVINGDGIVQSVNPATEGMFGFPAAELVGHNVSILMPSPYREEHQKYMRHYQETGEARIIGTNRQLVGQHRNGTTFPISLSISEIDHLGLFVGIIHNISEVRQLQREVLRSADEVQWRIGQTLHDGPQQSLAGLSLLSRGLALDLQRLDSRLEPQARRLSNGLQEANRNIRSLARGLIPTRVEKGDDIVDVLRRLAEKTSGDHGIACDLVCPEPILIENEYVLDQLYHIAQEAISNAVKHSTADRISISLERQGATITLQIADNGEGFDPELVTVAGLGLYIMPYRAATIGAHLTVLPSRDTGTVVKCVFSDIADSYPS